MFSSSRAECIVRSRFFLFLLSVQLVLGISSPRAIGQTAFGSLTGTIKDQSGAIIPDASLTLTNLGTGLKNTARSNGSGSYAFASLIPGRYRFDVLKQGFQHYTQANVTILVQTATTLDVTLQVGQTTQTVTVTSQTALLQTASPSISSVIGGREVEQAPLNGRNVMDLVELVPGVLPQGGSEGNPATNNTSAWGNFQIGGAFADQSAEYFDGVLLNTNYANQPALIPTQDAIQEFIVTTNNVGAEFGSTAGGVVNIASKPGTSAFHGEAYEYIRNKVLNGNTFFGDLEHEPKPAFTQNQYGATLGGPIKRDKAFFFFSWEGFALRKGNVAVDTVPTIAERGGDFSAAGLTPIYDPCTNGINDSTGLCSSTPATRSQFPGNIIPTTRINPVSAALLKLYPVPNLPST